MREGAWVTRESWEFAFSVGGVEAKIGFVGGCPSGANSVSNSTFPTIKRKKRKGKDKRGGGRGRRRRKKEEGKTLTRTSCILTSFSSLPFVLGEGYKIVFWSHDFANEFDKIKQLKCNGRVP